MIRALLDTNVVVSAFLWGGLPQQIIAHMTTNEGVLLSSEPLIAELRRTLAKPKFSRTSSPGEPRLRQLCSSTPDS